MNSNCIAFRCRYRQLKIYDHCMRSFLAWVVRHTQDGNRELCVCVSIARRPKVQMGCCTDFSERKLFPPFSWENGKVLEEGDFSENIELSITLYVFLCTYICVCVCMSVPLNALLHTFHNHYYFTLFFVYVSQRRNVKFTNMRPKGEPSTTFFLSSAVSSLPHTYP